MSLLDGAKVALRRICFYLIFRCFSSAYSYCYFLWSIVAFSSPMKWALIAATLDSFRSTYMIRAFSSIFRCYANSASCLLYAISSLFCFSFCSISCCACLFYSYSSLSLVLYRILSSFFFFSSLGFTAFSTILVAAADGCSVCAFLRVRSSWFSDVAAAGMFAAEIID